ncbi:type I restriction enzyme, S subunit [Nitrosomonas sp. Nm51]|uniref:restriction endonuclease subunit S n=1 Tax=Nitrosomonas sp. Nm51 TaxID=133720 RepID=UPI0008AE304B|nr:restriction endonuclease subunit S [Nitrosomonas sp. Nm51]SER19736.1 type I restriction enzyme, S subunit [Nitrosomonas sp. Nm51]
MSWTERSIGEISKIVTKGTTPSTYGMPFTENGVNFIKAEALNGDVTLDRSGFTFVDDETHEKLKRSQLIENDVLITIAGANVGKCGFVRQSDVPANANQAVGIIRVKSDEVNPRYIYYHFKKPATFAMCQGIGGGQAAQPNINLTVLKNFKVNLPDVQYQNKVVEIIEAYDGLIENNKRRIALLEESARQLYKEWFVRFRYPGHEHVKIVDGVPEGWEKIDIGNLASFLSRGMTPKYDDEGEFIVINQKCIRNRLLSFNLVRRQDKEVDEKKLIRYGDVLINSTGTGTLGRVAQCWTNPNKCTVDTHVTIVRPKDNVDKLWFGYSLMELECRFEDMGEGATNQKELKKSLVSALSVVLPPKIITKQFEDIITNITNQIVVLSDQNNNLTRARDLLLPKLMNGEIAV